MQDILDLREIGLRVRQQRDFLKITREEFAEILGVSVNFCRDIEIGAKAVSIQTLAKLVNILKLSPDYILFGNTANKSTERVIRMLDTCNEKTYEFLIEIIKEYLLSHEKQDVSA